jgi:hypothetical protein
MTQYCQATMLKVRDLRAVPLRWAIIAARLNCSVASLKVTYSRWQRGQSGGWTLANATEAMIRECESGRTTREIADRHHRTIQNVCSTLAFHGYDAEVRALYRKEPLL